MILLKKWANLFGWFRCASRSFDSASIYFIKMIIKRHLIVWKGVQLALPADQEMQESKTLEPLSHPPQTTSLPPDRRERVWPALG